MLSVSAYILPSEVCNLIGLERMYIFEYIFYFYFGQSLYFVPTRTFNLCEHIIKKRNINGRFCKGRGWWILSLDNGLRSDSLATDSTVLYLVNSLGLIQDDANRRGIVKGWDSGPHKAVDTRSPAHSLFFFFKPEMRLDFNLCG